MRMVKKTRRGSHGSLVHRQVAFHSNAVPGSEFRRYLHLEMMHKCGERTFFFFFFKRAHFSSPPVGLTLRSIKSNTWAATVPQLRILHLCAATTAKNSTCSRPPHKGSRMLGLILRLHNSASYSLIRCGNYIHTYFQQSSCPYPTLLTTTRQQQQQKLPRQSWLEHHCSLE